jgi:hypothetical protein
MGSCLDWVGYEIWSIKLARVNLTWLELFMINCVDLGDRGRKQILMADGSRTA